MNLADSSAQKKISEATLCSQHVSEKKIGEVKPSSRRSSFLELARRCLSYFFSLDKEERASVDFSTASAFVLPSNTLRQCFAGLSEQPSWDRKRQMDRTNKAETNRLRSDIFLSYSLSIYIHNPSYTLQTKHTHKPTRTPVGLWRDYGTSDAVPHEQRRNGSLRREGPRDISARGSACFTRLSKCAGEFSIEIHENTLQTRRGPTLRLKKRREHLPACVSENKIFFFGLRWELPSSFF